MRSVTQKGSGKIFQWMVAGGHGLTCPVQCLTQVVELGLRHVSEVASIHGRKMVGSCAKEKA